MGIKTFAVRLFASVMLMLPVTTWASHPLITDDAGTVGKGKFQLEVNGQSDKDKSQGVTTTSGEYAVGLTYGATESIDISVGLPYAWYKPSGGDMTKGVSDASIDVKVRLYEKDGLGFAVKPGVSLPTGDETKGLGTGKTGYQLFFIGSKEVEPWAAHINLGYIRNENNAGEEKNLWHASVAGLYSAGKNLKLAANIGVEKNPDPAAENDPAFALLGVIYSATESIDLDFGIKHGLTSSEVDQSLMAGITVKF